MKILHTSDWHLGRTFHQESLHAQQAALLEQVRLIAIDQEVDVIVIAGDIYDRAVPPIEALQLFESTLVELTKVAKVIVTSGNHDSAIRLGFGSPMMQDSLSIRTDTKQIFDPVLLADDEQNVAFYALPYLLPDVLRFELAANQDEPLARSHQAVWDEATRRIQLDLALRKEADPTIRSVVIGHAFIIGGVASDSERDITVGGIDSVGSYCLEGFDYVALGHLHGPQEISCAGDTVITYSGSLMRYSFSEATHQKSVTIVSLDPGQRATYERIPLRQERQMALLEGTLAEILSRENIEAHSQDWVRARVTDPIWPENLQTRVRNEFPHAVLVEHRPPAKTELAGLPSEQIGELSVSQILNSFLTEVANIDPDQETIQLFTDAFNAVSEDSA